MEKKSNFIQAITKHELLWRECILKSKLKTLAFCLQKSHDTIAIGAIVFCEEKKKLHFSVTIFLIVILKTNASWLSATW